MSFDFKFDKESTDTKVIHVVDEVQVKKMLHVNICKLFAWGKKTNKLHNA